MLIRNANVVLAERTLREVDVLFDDSSGIIEKVERGISPGGGDVYDASGLYVLPGLVDAHAHLREPGLTHKEDFLTGTMAALAGGVTTVIDMPNTVPPTTSLAALEDKKSLASKKSACDYAFHFGAASGNEEEALDAAPLVAGKKVFVGSSSFAQAISGGEMQSHFAYPKPVLVHAEDEAMIVKLEGEYKKLEGESATCRLHNKIRPSEAAASAVKMAIDAARKTRCHLHVCHVTSAPEVDLIRQAKADGVNVSCEVTPHHLFLSEASCEKLGNLSKVNPPLRSREDVSALWAALGDGTIDCIATDHAPHTLEEKRKGYWEAPSGMPGLETMLPLLLDAQAKGRLTLEKIAELASRNPARKFGLHHKGAIEKGKDADFVLVDLGGRTRVSAENLHTKCGWSAFEGLELQGTIRAVFLRGRQVVEGEHLVASPGGGKGIFDAKR